MPFTFAHPAFAIPLRSIRPQLFSVTGLILGSMSPDFEYFLHLAPYRSIGHTLLGLVVQAIPLCILLALVFHRIVKRPLAAHLPSCWQLSARASQLITSNRSFRFTEALFFLLSVIIGFVTHIVVDEFTHQSGYFVERFTWLNEAVVSGVPVYKLLQHGATLTGGLYLAIRLIRLLVNAEPPAAGPRVAWSRKLMYWLVTAATALAVTFFKISISPITNIREAASILAVAPISGGCLGLVIASLIFHYRGERE